MGRLSQLRGLHDVLMKALRHAISVKVALDERRADLGEAGALLDDVNAVIDEIDVAIRIADMERA